MHLGVSGRLAVNGNESEDFMSTELGLQHFQITVPYEYTIKPLHDGVQVLIRFYNGAGASVVRHSGSYGYESELWEIAPILFQTDIHSNWEFIGQALDLPGFSYDDVQGWLQPFEVDQILSMIAAL
jgi:hypothetical protein